MIKIYIEKNYDDLSKRAADIIFDFIKSKSLPCRLPTGRQGRQAECVLGLATGSTPVKTYDLLSLMHKKEKISFKKITTFNLDDYLGLNPTDSQSYHFHMKKNFFGKTDIDIKNTFFPNDFKPYYEKYDEKIKKAGGIDIQILGIGSNGHIGFNEPGSKFLSKTREVSLSENTIKDNSRFFKSIKDVPKKAATMGIKTIMKARKIILLASGESKKEAIFRTLCVKPSIKTPASVLQKHKNVIVILDRPAAKKIIGKKIKGL